MATAGYSMKFGKGYLGGNQSAPAEPETGQEPEQEGGEEHHEAIRAHLEDMHQRTGHAHSHVEHHGDGRHTSHHISAEGEHSGPHEHGSDEEMMEHMGHVAGGHQEPDGDEGGEKEDEY